MSMVVHVRAFDIVSNERSKAPPVDSDVVNLCSKIAFGIDCGDGEGTLIGK